MTLFHDNWQKIINWRTVRRVKFSWNEGIAAGENKTPQNKTKLDLCLDRKKKRFIIVSKSILLKYLFSRFELFINIMRFLRVIKTKRDFLQYRTDGEFRFEEEGFKAHKVFVTLQLVIWTIPFLCWSLVLQGSATLSLENLIINQERNFLNFWFCAFTKVFVRFEHRTTKKYIPRETKVFIVQIDNLYSAIQPAKSMKP